MVLPLMRFCVWRCVHGRARLLLWRWRFRLATSKRDSVSSQALHQSQAVFLELKSRNRFTACVACTPTARTYLRFVLLLAGLLSI